MNSSDNFSASTKKYSDSSSDTAPIDNLLDLLLDSEQSESSSSSESIPNEGSDLLLAASRQVSESQIDFELQKSPDKDSDPIDSDSFEPEIEIDDRKAKLTLKEVEYKAFRQETTKPNQKQNSARGRSKISFAEQQKQLLAIETESASSEELIEYINTLIPLMVELLRYKVNNSRDGIIQAVTPVIEQLIEQRSVEEPEKVAIAVAKILPSAIAQEINLSPAAIAKAIAPEVALSIREQIRLDEDAISQALGPEMGKAIKAQIELERDAMVDALYPVIGNTISKYMVEVVQEINRKVENTLSPEGFKRKIRAKIQGVSEAELILQESVGCHVQAVFLIDKDSGIVIEKFQKQGEDEPELDSDMVAGMLTAIRSFANDCIVSDSELDTIDYGNWQIHLEVAGYCYLAVVLRGEPTKESIGKIRHVFGEIVLNYGSAIEKFEGDFTTVPPAIKPKLSELTESEQEESKQASSPTTLLWLIALILAIIFVPWGILRYRSKVARNIEQFTAIQLDAAPELSVYRLEPEVSDGVLTITGRVPSEELRQQATTITEKIAAQNELELDNQIIAVDVPADSNTISGEIERLTELLNQQPEVAIQSNYQSHILSVDGFILDKTQQEKINRAFSQIPGIKQVIFNLASQLPVVEQRIYFEVDSNNLNFADNSSKIESIMQFLNQFPQLHLKLIAYSDGIGSDEINQRLAQERCSNVRAELVARGVDPARLVTDCQQLRFSSERDRFTSQITRYVGFEPFIPKKYSN